MSTRAWRRVAMRLDESGEPDESLCNGISGEYAKGLHIGAIFVVLFASLIGTVLPLITLYVPFLRRNPFVFVVAKTAATGVLLSVSTIHLLGDGIEAFSEPCVPSNFTDAYPAYHMLFAIVSALVMHYVDYKMLAIGESWMRRKKAKGPEDQAPNEITQGETQCASRPVCDQESSEVVVNQGNVLRDGAATRLSPTACSSDSGEQDKAKGRGQKTLPAFGHTEDGDGATAPHERPCSDNHAGAAELPGCGHPHSVQPPDDMGHLRRVIAAICMEFGITLHSLFVGLDVGLKTDRSLKPLLIALVFHQLFEGMSMGARLVDAKFHIALDFVLAFVFSFSAPIGMSAATIAVFVKPDAMSGGGFVLMMAVLDSVCAGILLYLAFSLLFIDFSTEMKNFCSPGMPRRGLKKNIMFISLWAGMLIMALIGKWC